MKTKLIQSEKSGSDKPFQLYRISGKVTQSVYVSSSKAGTGNMLRGLEAGTDNKPPRVYL